MNICTPLDRLTQKMKETFAVTGNRAFLQLILALSQRTTYRSLVPAKSHRTSIHPHQYVKVKLAILILHLLSERLLLQGWGMFIEVQKSDKPNQAVALNHR